MDSLHGHTVLVTGASRGLGAAIALELRAQGASVAVNYAFHREPADQVCRQIREGGGKASAFRADVRSAEEVPRLVGEITALFGEIDSAVINATGPQPALAIEEQTWQACLDQLEFFVKSP